MTVIMSTMMATATSVMVMHAIIPLGRVVMTTRPRVVVMARMARR